MYLLLHKSSDQWIWNKQYILFESNYVEIYFTGKDPDGRRWTTSDMRNPGYRPNLRYEYKGYKPHRNGWSVSRKRWKNWIGKAVCTFPRIRRIVFV